MRAFCWAAGLWLGYVALMLMVVSFYHVTRQQVFQIAWPQQRIAWAYLPDNFLGLLGIALLYLGMGVLTWHALQEAAGGGRRRGSRERRAQRSRDRGL